jgi:excinuclease ABC subunit C
MVSLNASKLDYIIVDSEFEALLLEAELIRKFQPKYNRMLKDDRSPSYVKISKEKFPKVSIVRRYDGEYGPYLNSQTIKSVLRYLRNIFPYRTCNKLPKKACLYYGLNLCTGVCINQSDDSINEYSRNIHHLKSLLSAKKDKVIKDLEREMYRESRLLNFEKAKIIRNRIGELNYLFQKRHFPREYMENNFLVKEIRKDELKELSNIVKVDSLERIEGYDISNISGKQATGSMVVFLEGDSESGLYRRFKIRLTNSPDDPKMMAEMVSRRLKHKEWNYPSLILVDGGKTQISAVLKTVGNCNLKIPIIGLAKKNEELIKPLTNHQYEIIKLKSNSPALNLIKRIRDESHRFAKKYHIYLSGKNTFT